MAEDWGGIFFHTTSVPFAMRRRKRSTLHENQERWLLTYADLISAADRI